ncbi:MAG TPA: barstar family protein [Aggregatilineales bacterium]|nr:barstar family protein [Aggregatilineales bacterium]
MKSITTVFKDYYPSGIYYLHTGEHPEDLATQVEAFDFCFFYLDGKRIGSAFEFADEVIPAMNFPDMGNTWDAFLDRLRELDQWCPGKKGYVLVYDWHKHFLESDAEHFGYFMDVVKDACKFFDEKTETPFYMFFRASAYLPVAE